MSKCKPLSVWVRKTLGKTNSISSAFSFNLNYSYRCFSASSGQYNKKSIVFYPRPIVAFNNWCYGHLVREYFRQDFDLDDFCNACPIILKQIIDCLVGNDTDSLKEAVKEDCLEGIISKWNQLSSDQKNSLVNLKTNDIGCGKPTIQMQLPEKLDPTKELPGFLRISVFMYFFIKDNNMVSKSILGNKISHNFDIPLPIVHSFEFIREVTRGVNDSWTLLKCSFPSMSE